MMEYAGFWRRLAAAIVDAVLVVTAGFGIGLALGITEGLTGIHGTGLGEGLEDFAGLLLGWLYAAGMESSPRQATLGKLALGLRVTDLEGDPVGFWRATGRHFGKILSAVLLCFGFAMVAFTERKQGLHDILSGCLVLRR